MDEILDFLYYQTPIEYELTLSGPQDPGLDKISTERIIFKNYLLKCTLKEYCQLIIKAFIKTYPKSSSLTICLLDSDDRGLFSLADRPFRSTEVKRIDFNYKKAKLHGRFDPKTLRTLEYLDELKVTFKAAQPDLADWVEQALTRKSFNKTINGSNTVFKVSNSPILTLEVDTTSFTIFIDKKTFIEYLFQSRGYDE